MVIQKIIKTPYPYILLVIIFVIFRLKKKNSIDKQGEALGTHSTVYVEKKKISTAQKDMSQSEIKALATRLYKAMCDIGTEDKVVDEVYDQVKGNITDLRALYNAFGTPAYNMTGAPMANFIKGVPLDMKEWINKELSGKRLASWNALFTAAQIK